MDTHELGHCPECTTYHLVPTAGAVKGCGALCSLGIVVAGKQPMLGLALAAASLLFGDAVERWFTARCPECGVALQLVAAATKAA